MESKMQSECQLKRSNLTHAISIESKKRETKGKGASRVGTFAKSPTELVSANTTLKPIEEIRIGDYVWAWDDQTQTHVAKRVNRTFLTPTQVIYQVGYIDLNGVSASIRGTKEHPFWVQGKGWVPLHELQRGDSLKLKSESSAMVHSVAVCSMHEDVFNFEVGGVHNYFVGESGVLVHNSSTKSHGAIYFESLPPALSGIEAAIPFPSVKSLNPYEFTRLVNGQLGLDSDVAPYMPALITQFAASIDLTQAREVDMVQAVRIGTGSQSAAFLSDPSSNEVLLFPHNGDTNVVRAEYATRLAMSWLGLPVQDMQFIKGRVQPNHQVKSKFPWLNVGDYAYGYAEDKLSTFVLDGVPHFKTTKDLVLDEAFRKMVFGTPEEVGKATLSLDDEQMALMLVLGNQHLLSDSKQIENILDGHRVVKGLPFKFPILLPDFQPVITSKGLVVRDTPYIVTGHVAEDLSSLSPFVINGQLNRDPRSLNDTFGQGNAPDRFHLYMLQKLHAHARRLESSDAFREVASRMSLGMSSDHTVYHEGARLSANVGGGCFVAGTLVRTDLGLKAIELVGVGDKVWAQPENGGEWAYREVTHTFVYDNKPVCRVQIMNANGRLEAVTATHEHPFWVNEKGWIGALHLNRDDLVQLHNGQLATVVDVKELPETATVYNMTVDEFHTYCVGVSGVWVHNTSGELLALRSLNESVRRGFFPVDIDSLGTIEQWHLAKGTTLVGPEFEFGPEHLQHILSHMDTPTYIDNNREQLALLSDENSYGEERGIPFERASLLRQANAIIESFPEGQPNRAVALRFLAGGGEHFSGYVPTRDGSKFEIKLRYPRIGGVDQALKELARVHSAFPTASGVTMGDIISATHIHATVVGADLMAPAVSLSIEYMLREVSRGNNAVLDRGLSAYAPVNTKGLVKYFGNGHIEGRAFDEERPIDSVKEFFDSITRPSTGFARLAKLMSEHPQTLQKVWAHKGARSLAERNFKLLMEHADALPYIMSGFEPLMSLDVNLVHKLTRGKISTIHSYPR